MSISFSKVVEEHPQRTYDRPFRTLFEDGVALLRLAEASDDHDLSNSLARGSIACTMLLPETAANTCIESLHLEATIFNEIDRLSPLGKFDYFLNARYRGRKVSAGALPVQKLRELKRLRDSFVHAKKYQVNWTPNSDGSYSGVSRRTQFLDMSSNPTMWFRDDAVNAMKGAHCFLSFFFSEVCRMPKGEVTGLLFSDDVSIGEKGGRRYYYERTFHASLKAWEVDTTYFRMGVV